MQRVLLGLYTLALQAMFVLGAWSKRGRATHTYGVAAAGTARIVDHPTFPAHELFSPGRSFPVQVRHATIAFEDDAVKDVRSASLKFSDQPFESPLDLIMNSGTLSPFWNVPTFLQFVRASLQGEQGLERYSKRYPLAHRAAVDSLRRAPESFAKLPYSTMLVFRFESLDGREYLCRYRLLPEPRDSDSGVATGADRDAPWLQQRLPDETRPKDYLRQELIARLARGPVRYHLQIQLHEREANDSEELYSSADRWDEATHPWRDLAAIELTRALSREQNEALGFSVACQPPSLGLWPARSIYDYNSIGHVRSRVYPWARRSRQLAYRLRGLGPPEDPTIARPPAAQRWVVTGVLVHADEREEPLHGVTLELRDKDLFDADPLGEAVTDEAGRFEITFDPALAGRADRPDLVLCVMEIERTRDEHDQVVQTRRLMRRIPGQKDAQGPLFNFGRLRVEWWEYDDAMGLPRVRKGKDGELPQRHPPSYTPELILGAFPAKVLNEAHHLRAHSGEPLTVDEVQRGYDALKPCLTTCVESETPGRTRGDEWFGWRVLNGFNPVLPREVEGSDGEYRVVYEWDRYESDGVHDVPNVDARFHVKDGRFLPLSITISLRAAGQTRPFADRNEPFTCTPADGERWQQAKRVFRAAWSLAGECDAHLAGCHLNMEQYAVAAWRNLRQNPVRDLLFPHLREVVLINEVGDSAIFGTQGILATNTPFTPDAARQRLVEHLGRLDWTGWRPRRPISENHDYAYVANTYWDVLTTYVDEFFAANRAEIERHWFEVFRFSDDLVRHSVPVTLDDHPRDFYDDAELDKPVPREPIADGTLRAVRPITATHQAPGADDLENLKQVCRYVIFHATLGHTWTNDRQLEDGGEIRYATLALRNGCMGSEHDESVLPPAMECSDQLFFAHALNAQTRGMLLQNEDEDIPARLIELVHSKKAEFERYGFPPGRIRSRINI